MCEKYSMIMQCRQRSSAAIHFNGPDLIPVMHMYLTAALYQHGENLKKLWAEFPQDFGDLSHLPIPTPRAECILPDGRYYETRTDDWGAVWESSIYGILGHPLKRPLDDISQLSNFKPPKVPSIGGLAFQADKKEIDDLKKHFYCCRGWVSIFEVMHAVRRFEDVLMDIYEDTPEINHLADLITDYWARIIDYYISLDVDGIQFGDDFGTQQALMTDLATWRRFFKPRYARLMEPIRKAGKDIFFHSCGHTLPLVEDLSDLGVNVFLAPNECQRQ